MIRTVDIVWLVSMVTGLLLSRIVMFAGQMWAGVCCMGLPDEYMIRRYLTCLVL